MPLQIESLHIILILYISTKYRKRNTSIILKNTHTSTEKGRRTRGARRSVLLIRIESYKIIIRFSIKSKWRGIIC